MLCPAVCRDKPPPRAAGVAVLMGGGPALMYAESVLQALNDFGAKQA